MSLTAFEDSLCPENENRGRVFLWPRGAFIGFSDRFFIEFFVGSFFIGLFGREGESVGLPAGVLGYADVCVELHYGLGQHH